MHLITANAVIAAHSFNPSILSQLWLVRNNIVAEEDFQSNCLFAEGVSQVDTSRFLLVALPDRLQVVPKDPSDQSALEAVVTRIATALPHTPYTAIGLNFVIHYDPQGESIGQLTRRLFFRGDVPLYREFDNENSHFGAYLSKAYGEMRLKLDIKPITLQTVPGETLGRLQFSFNFHQDLGPNAVESIGNAIGHWMESLQTAMRIANECVGQNVKVEFDSIVQQ
jgi:hypothetical protein